MYIKYIFIVLLIIIFIILYNRFLLYVCNKKFIKFFFNVEIINKDFYIKPFYFIHIPKNMGMNVFSSVPNKYFKKYFGLGYTSSNILNIARSHLLLKDCYKHYKEIKEIPKIAIIRQPYERFISICNFLHMHPSIFIFICKIQNKNNTLPSIFNLFNFTKRQYEFIEPLDNTIKLIDFNDKKTIFNTFTQYNVILDLSVKKNKSNKIYTLKSLTKNHKKFIKEYYHKDFELYDKIKKNQISY